MWSERGRSLVIPRERSSLVARGTDGPAHSRKARSVFRTTWTWPGFLFPSTARAADRSGCCDPRLPDPSRGLSRRFNSRCSRALPSIEGRESTPFAVVGPECRTRGRCPRAIGARLLVAPAVLSLREGGSKSRDGPRGRNRSSRGESERRQALLPSLPRALLAAEKGGSAPCTAPAEASYDGA